MRFSVLMSVYKNDNADFLYRALTSIYEDQTRKPDEIVVVFDGPLTEALYQVLNDFAKDKPGVVHYYPQNVNQGLGEALRIGVEMCTGDYIFRMDSDDICHPYRFKKQVDYLKTHPEVDVLGTDIAEFYQSPDESCMRVRSCPAEHKNIAEFSKTRTPMNHVTVCIKKESLLRCGNYKTLFLLEDYYLWLRMLAADCVFANINESLVYVRIGNGFHSRRGSKVHIKGRKFLQEYMLEHDMIKKRKAWKNMFCICVFTYCPSWLRRIVYDKILRM